MQSKADKANILKHPAAEECTINSLLTRTQLSRHCLIFALWLTLVTVLQTQVCFSALPAPPVYFQFSLRDAVVLPNPQLSLYAPFLFIFPPCPSPKTWLTHGPVACGKMGHSVSIIEGVQMPKYRCQWQPNITCLQKWWPAAALTCLCYWPELSLILTTGLLQLNSVVVKKTPNKTAATARQALRSRPDQDIWVPH